MEEILRFIEKHCFFLYSSHTFQIVESDSSESFGNALVILEDEDLRLQFVKDRDQLFLDFQPTNYKKEWFSIDIVKQLVSGDIEPSSEIDSEKAEFLKFHLDKIKELFSPTKFKNTLKKLKELERARAKRLFG
ncbi:MAG: hypothetical protein EU542_02875 [Promethearchaeota archaeon]|nr:MAG: hypothetical protein EU542_02875 [Candidatus Lokiarchaeota archaeon]